MARLIKTELWKIKRYSVIWIGIATMLSVVLLTCFMEMGTPGTPTFSSFSDNVIWNSFSLIFPATIVLLLGKVFVCGMIAVFLAVVELLFTALISLFCRYEGIALSSVMKSLVQMVGMNCFVFISVLPVIVFTGQRAGAFMTGVAFAFFYGFIGTFASGHGLSCLYPVTIGLGFINYQNGMETGTYNIFRCVVVLLIMLVITAVMLLLAQDRSKTQKIKGKGDIQ